MYQLFKEMKILNFTDMYNYQCAIFMFQCYLQILPKSLLKLFILNCNIHHYSIRNAENFHLPLVHTTSYKRTVIFNGPCLWSTIPRNIRELKFVNTSKRK